MNDVIDRLLKAAAAVGGVGAVSAGVGALVSKMLSDRLLESRKGAPGKELERLKVFRYQP